MEIKVCSVCKVEKSIEQFRHQRRVCKQCRNVQNKYYRTRTEEQREIDVVRRNEQLKQQHLEAVLKRQTHTCECGAVYLMMDKKYQKQHEQTKKHRQFIEFRERAAAKKEYKITYYDEQDEYRKNIVWITKEEYDEFHNKRNYYKGTNYTLLKEMNFI